MPRIKATPRYHGHVKGTKREHNRRAKTMTKFKNIAKATISRRKRAATAIQKIARGKLARKKAIAKKAAALAYIRVMGAPGYKTFRQFI